jgi:hypothetical protein
MPVFILTVQVKHGMRDWAKEKGAKAVLQKPFGWIRFAKLVREYWVAGVAPK